MSVLETWYLHQSCCSSCACSSHQSSSHVKQGFSLRLFSKWTDCCHHPLSIVKENKRSQQNEKRGGGAIDRENGITCPPICWWVFCCCRPIVTARATLQATAAASAKNSNKNIIVHCCLQYLHGSDPSSQRIDPTWLPMNTLLFGSSMETCQHMRLSWVKTRHLYKDCNQDAFP